MKTLTTYDLKNSIRSFLTPGTEFICDDKILESLKPEASTNDYIYNKMILDTNIRELLKQYLNRRNKHNFEKIDISETVDNLPVDLKNSINVDYIKNFSFVTPLIPVWYVHCIDADESLKHYNNNPAILKSIYLPRAYDDELNCSYYAMTMYDEYLNKTFTINSSSIKYEDTINLYFLLKSILE